MCKQRRQRCRQSENGMSRYLHSTPGLRHKCHCLLCLVFWTGGKIVKMMLPSMLANIFSASTTSSSDVCRLLFPSPRLGQLTCVYYAFQPGAIIRLTWLRCVQLGYKDGTKLQFEKEKLVLNSDGGRNLS